MSYSAFLFGNDVLRRPWLNSCQAAGYQCLPFGRNRPQIWCSHCRQAGLRCNKTDWADPLRFLSFWQTWMSWHPRVCRTRSWSWFASHWRMKWLKRFYKVHWFWEYFEPFLNLLSSRSGQVHWFSRVGSVGLNVPQLSRLATVYVLLRTLWWYITVSEDGHEVMVIFRAWSAVSSESPKHVQGKGAQIGHGSGGMIKVSVTSFG